MTDVTDEEWLVEQEADVRQAELTKRLGQVTCPRPHVYLFAQDSRCYCGSQV